MIGANEIIPNLYIGDYRAGDNVYYLTFNHFNVVVRCLCSPSNHLLYNGIDYYHIPIEDNRSENLLKHLPDILQYIHQKLTQGKKILVHCWAGKSRSPAIVIGYLMYRLNISYDEAYKIVKNKRRIVKLNSGFEEQLRSISF